MAIRTDVSVDFSVSPRIVTVAAPSTTISIQDLNDTLRSIEASIWNMSYLALVRAGGKDFIATGELVGVTLRLLDAKLAFAARPGPAFVQCTVSGGNITAVDSDGAPIDPIETTDYTQIVYRGSTSATLLNNTADLADAVWSKATADGVPAGSYGAQATLDAARINLARMMLTNRLDLSADLTDNWKLYDDNGALYMTFTIRDASNGGVIASPGASWRRTKGELA